LFVFTICNFPSCFPSSQLDKAAQGKDGSATDVMPQAKKILSAKDLFRQAARFNVKINYHPRHPVRSIHCQVSFRGVCSLFFALSFPPIVVTAS
jgi:hypothetical protein